MTSALDSLFEMFDEVCTPDTGSDECIAFVEEYCGKLDPSGPTGWRLVGIVN